MALEVRDARLTDLIDSEAEVAQIATGCQFTEGPLWHATEQFLLFSDIPANKMRRWDANAGMTVSANLPVVKRLDLR